MHETKVDPSRTFRGDASTNLNIRFFNDHEFFQLLATSATIFGSEKPFAIGFRQSLDRNDTNTGGIIATVTWAETYTPFRLELGQLVRTVSR
jgi:hypothetical protein